jgi:cation:H+ antiporter
MLVRDLERWAGVLAGPGETSFLVRPGWGRVDVHLTRLAADLAADLIVVGTHHRSGVARVWQGSVSREVLHGASTSVACVPRAEDLADEEPRFVRVLALTDLSPMANRAVPFAYGLVGRGVVVHLLHVVTRAPGEDDPAPEAPLRALIPASAAGRGVETVVEVISGRDAGHRDLPGRRAARRRRDLHGDPRAQRPRPPGPGLAGPAGGPAQRAPGRAGAPRARRMTTAGASDSRGRRAPVAGQPVATSDDPTGGMSLAVVLAVLLATGLALTVAGSALGRAADAIATTTGLGRVWVGTVLLAGATSLPELATDIAAVRIGAPDLAVGDLFGSTMANMLIRAAVDLALPHRQLLRQAAYDHVLGASLAIGLTAVAAALVLASPSTTVLGIAPGSVVLVLMYLAGTRALYRQGIRTTAVPPAANAAAEVPPARSRLTAADRAIARFAALALAVVAVAPWFAWSAQPLAEISGLGSTFIGTVLVGLSTSLPELVASLAAVRIGAVDLAVGNLFGSCAFNIVVFVALHVAQPGGSVFTAVQPDPVTSALLGILLLSVGLGATVYRAERRTALLEASNALMVLIYLVGLGVLYQRAGS